MPSFLQRWTKIAAIMASKALDPSFFEKPQQFLESRRQAQDVAILRRFSDAEMHASHAAGDATNDVPRAQACHETFVKRVLFEFRHSEEDFTPS